MELEIFAIGRVTTERRRREGELGRPKGQCSEGKIKTMETLRVGFL